VDSFPNSTVKIMHQLVNADVALLNKHVPLVNVGQSLKVIVSELKQNIVNVDAV
jgi:hypothetical protein